MFSKPSKITFTIVHKAIFGTSNCDSLNGKTQPEWKINQCLN